VSQDIQAFKRLTTSSHIEKVLNVGLSDIYNPLGLIQGRLEVTPKRPLNFRPIKDDDFRDYQDEAKKL